MEKDEIILPSLVQSKSCEASETVSWSDQLVDRARVYVINAEESNRNVSSVLLNLKSLIEHASDTFENDNETAAAVTSSANMSASGSVEASGGRGVMLEQNTGNKGSEFAEATYDLLQNCLQDISSLKEMVKVRESRTIKNITHCNNIALSLLVSGQQTQKNILEGKEKEKNIIISPSSTSSIVQLDDDIVSDSLDAELKKLAESLTVNVLHSLLDKNDHLSDLRALTSEAGVQTSQRESGLVSLDSIEHVKKGHMDEVQALQAKTNTVESELCSVQDDLQRMQALRERDIEVISHLHSVIRSSTEFFSPQVGPSVASTPLVEGLSNPFLLSPSTSSKQFQIPQSIPILKLSGNNSKENDGDQTATKTNTDTSTPSSSDINGILNFLSPETRAEADMKLSPELLERLTRNIGQSKTTAQKSVLMQKECQETKQQQADIDKMTTAADSAAQLRHLVLERQRKQQVDFDAIGTLLNRRKNESEVALLPMPSPTKTSKRSNSKSSCSLSSLDSEIAFADSDDESISEIECEEEEISLSSDILSLLENSIVTNNKDNAIT